MRVCVRAMLRTTEARERPGGGADAGGDAEGAGDAAADAVRMLLMMLSTMNMMMMAGAEPLML